MPLISQVRTKISNFLEKARTEPASDIHETKRLLDDDRDRADRARTAKEDRDRLKNESKAAKDPATHTPNAHRLVRLRQWCRHKITDVKSVIEKKNTNFRAAGWGIGTISGSTIISFKRSKKTRSILGFKTRLYTPRFFTYRSTTIDQPIVRQAARDVHPVDRLNSIKNTLNVNNDIKAEFPSPKSSNTVQKEEEAHLAKFKIDNDRQYIRIIRDTEETLITGNTHVTSNGEFSEEMTRIFGELRELHKNNPKKPLTNADDQMRTLAFALLGTAQDAVRVRTNKINETQCLHALTYLRGISLEKSFTTFDQQAGSVAAPVTAELQTEDLAWRIAYKLAETPMGFDLLKLLTAQPIAAAEPGAAAPVNLSPEETKAAQESAQKKIRQDTRIRMFMQGARELMKERHNNHEFSCKPSKLTQYCLEQSFRAETLDNTLLIKALPAVQFAICKESGVEDEDNYKIVRDNALGGKIPSRLTNPEGVVAAVEKKAAAFREISESTWPINALRNGFYSNAPGSIFDKANKRLEKVSVQLTRALSNKGIEASAVEKEDVKKIDKQGRLYRWMKPFKLSGKSMFNGSLYFGHSTNGPLIQREKMQLALHVMEKRLSETGDVPPEGGGAQGIAFGMSDDPNMPPHSYFARFTGEQNVNINNENLTKNIAKILMLRSWLKMPPSENISGYALSDKEFKKDEKIKFIGSKFGVETELGNSAPGSIEFFAQIAAQLEKLKEEQLTPSLLRRWGSSAGLVKPMTAPPLPVPGADVPQTSAAGAADAAAAAAPEAPAAAVKVAKIPTPHEIRNMNQEQYSSHFFNALDHLENGMDSEEITLKENTREGTINYVQAQIERMRLGSTVKLTDGAALGIGLQGTFAAFSRAATATIASARASFSGRLGRVAEMDVGVNAAGGFARFGVLADQRTRAGAGGSVGWRVGKKSATTTGGLSGGVDVKGIYDKNEFEGVGLRLDRLGGDITGKTGQVAGVAGDAALVDDLGEIVAKVMRGRADRDTAPDSTLLEQLLGFNEALSVTWIAKKTRVSRTTGTASQVSAIAGVHTQGVGGAALSLSAGLTQTRIKRHVVERNGASTSEAIASGHRTVGSLQAAATFGIINSEMGNDPHFAKIGVSGAELVLGDAEIYRSGVTEEIRTVEYMGVLQPRTYKLIIHANAKSFVDKVGQEHVIRDWGHGFAEIKNPKDYNRDLTDNDLPNHPRIAEVSKQIDNVRALLAEAVENAGPNVSHIEYLEIKPEVAEQININRDLAIMSRQANLLESENEATQLEESAEALLKDENSYRKRFLFSTERRATDEGHKVNMLLNFQSSSAASSTVMTNKGFLG